MNKRISNTLFLFSCILTVVVILITTGLLYFYFSQEQMDELKTQMEFLEPGVEESGVTYLKALNVNDRVTLINNKGDVIFDNYYPDSLENHLDREEVSEALNSGEAQSVRYSDTIGKKTVYYAKKLNNGDILRISMTRDTIFYLFTGFLQIYLFILIVILIISYFISKQLTKSLIKPIDNINLKDPKINSSYPELNPLLERISHQNNEIESQLKKVQRQQADFNTITANMNEGLIIIGNSGKIKNINESAQKLLDLDSSNLVKSSYSVLGEKLKDLIKSALKGNKDKITFEKNHRILRIIASPIIVSERQKGCVLIILDITENALRERLRSEYVSNVSHELKTPLTSISGFAEIINTGLAKPEDTKPFAGKIYDETQHLIHIVNDILTIGYLDEENRTVEKTDVNLKVLIETILERLENQIKDKKISVSMIVKGNTILTGNYDILTELFYNLIDNAIKYNKENGRIVIMINGNDPNKLLVKIIDSGIGIPEEDQERIFERFYRNKESRSSLIEGTGLGLSIVKHAAALHNAEVNVESQPGNGSSFIICFTR